MPLSIYLSILIKKGLCLVWSVALLRFLAQMTVAARSSSRFVAASLWSSPVAPQCGRSVRMEGNHGGPEKW